MSVSMEQGDYGITVIDTGYLREKFAASHMLVEEGKSAFIDVGTAHSVGRLLAALYASGLSEGDVAYLILTHIHLDHAGGVGHLMALFPKAQLVVHPKGAEHMHKRLWEQFGDQPERLREEIARLFDKAYAIYPQGQMSSLDLKMFLRDDIELNAQGIELWTARQKT